MQRSGLAAPAYNPRADKFYFRFFFAGLLMVRAYLDRARGQ